MNNHSESTYFNNKDFNNECVQFMTGKGFDLDKPFQPDGKFHRFSADDNQHKPDEWYIASEGISNKGNLYLCCTFGSWSSGEQYTYQSWKNDTQLSTEERKEFYEISQKNRADVEIKSKEMYDVKAKEAAEIWETCETEPPNKKCLRYAEAKGVDSTGVRFGKNPDGYWCMIVALKNFKGEIRTLQYISMDDSGKSYKRWMTGGEKKGNYHTWGEITNGARVYVSEGWATGASIRMSGTEPVVFGGDAGNLFYVVENIKKEYPEAIIIIAGDGDVRGQEAAINTAKKFGCAVVFPKFPEDKRYDPLDLDKKPYTDFNDLHKVCGLEEVKEQLEKTILVPTIQEDIRNIAHSFLNKEEPCASFSVSSLPPILADYISSICETTNAHPVMVTCSVISTVSAILGKRIFIPENEYFQRLYPNVWILCVAKSGQFKSTALYKGAKLALNMCNEIYKQMKTLQEQLKVASSDSEKNEIEDKILKASIQNPILPNKLTGEAFLYLLSQGHGGVILSSEFGALLQNFDKSHNNDFKAVMTELFDVQNTFRYATKTQGDLILKEPCFSLCGVSTLPWIMQSFKDSDVTSGFFARFLLFCPPFQNDIPPALPERKNPPNPRIEEKFNDILDVLNGANSISYIISEEAKLLFEEIHKDIHKMQRSYNDQSQDLLDPFVKRWSPYILKLAMIMQYFINPLDNKIGVEAIRSASSFILIAIKSTAQLFEGELGESEEQRNCRKLLTWICKRIELTGGKPVKRQEIFASRQIKAEKGRSDNIGYTQALKMLCESGQLDENQKPGGKPVDNKNYWEYVPKEIIRG